MIFCNYFYLLIILCLHRVIWFKYSWRIGINFKQIYLTHSYYHPGSEQTSGSVVSEVDSQHQMHFSVITRKLKKQKGKGY